MTAISPTPASIRLPAVMDLRSAGPLARDLLALRGQPVVLDASGVERVGGLGLQVLLSARRTWRADGLELRVNHPSEAFELDCARMCGLAFDEFNGTSAS